MDLGEFNHTPQEVSMLIKTQISKLLPNIANALLFEIFRTAYRGKDAYGRALRWSMSYRKFRAKQGLNRSLPKFHLTGSMLDSLKVQKKNAFHYTVGVSGRGVGLMLRSGKRMKSISNAMKIYYLEKQGKYLLIITPHYKKAIEREIQEFYRS